MSWMALWRGERRAEWIVDASWTLREVLERWAGRAGWTLVWKAENEYTLGAGARFDGEFLEVVDRLMAGSVVSRALVTTAYRSNRYLVVEDAGALW